MLFSQLFGRTLRVAPSDAKLPSHQLALHAGLVRFTGAGVYANLPLGWRVARALDVVLCEGLAALGGQEMLMAAMQPAELWRTTGGDEYIASTPVRVQDQSDRAYVLAASYDEVAISLARREPQSYRDLPRLVYQFQTTVRDRAHPPGGLLGALTRVR
jgi:prolyl-tRNA synthetase